MRRKMVSLFLFSMCSAFAQNSRPNFTGAWKWQDYEVELIEHQEPVFRIAPKIRRADVIFTYVFRTDGQMLRTKGKGSDEVGRSAHWEGNDLVLETKRINNSGQATERVTLSLSSNGREMTKHIQLFGPDNTKQADDLMVFEKVGNGVRR